VFGPLHIVARLQGSITHPSSGIAIDAILAAAVALRDNLPPICEQIADGQPLPPLQIPIMREPSGRFHLATFARPAFAQHERRYIHRRFPVAEAIAHSNVKIDQIDVTAGPNKSFRDPVVSSFLADDTLEWWCIGEQHEIEKLLQLVHYLGAMRKFGSGRVAEWRVTPCEAWEGFPVLREGRALRPLPLDWPGLADTSVSARIPLTFPYWRRSEATVCAVG
jgi:CRISPR type IV-associated protein Csf3